jgi:hypothetical protein
MGPDESTPMKGGATVSWFPIWHGWQNAAETAADSGQIFKTARSAANSCGVNRTAGDGELPSRSWIARSASQPVCL